MGLRVLVAAVVPVMCSYGHGTAEPWIVAEVPAAFAVSEPQRDAFRGGALPAIGLYRRAAPHVALGLRVRAGVLGDASTSMTPATGIASPGWGGLGTLSLAMRANLAGAWLEAAAGGGVTGADLVPAVELGVGWRSRVGAMEVGPSLRLLHVRAVDELGLGSADLVLVGLELRHAPPARVQPPRREITARREAVVLVTRDRDRLVDVVTGCAADPATCARAEPDRDALVDAVETCAALAEAMGEVGAEAGGCSAGGPIEVAADRIILDERVLFAVNRARVRRAGRPVMRAIASAWHRNAWDRIIIEGHADTRGAPEHNLWLSQERAERARAALVAAGVPAEAIEAIGRGATQPRSPEHERNRRVEFVIVPRPATTWSQP